MFECLRAEGDRGERVVDFMRHAGRQEADARQPLGPYKLAAPLLHLPLELGVGQADLGGHVIEGLGQVLHLVAGLQIDLVAERPSRHMANPPLQDAEREENPALKQQHQPAEHSQNHHRRDPDDHAAGVVLHLR